MGTSPVKCRCLRGTALRQAGLSTPKHVRTQLQPLLGFSVTGRQKYQTPSWWVSGRHTPHFISYSCKQLSVVVKHELDVFPFFSLNLMTENGELGSTTVAFMNYFNGIKRLANNLKLRITWSIPHRGLASAQKKEALIRSKPDGAEKKKSAKDVDIRSQITSFALVVRECGRVDLYWPER